MNKLRIVKGNTFKTIIEVRAYTYAGEEITNFDLNDCTDIVVNVKVKGKTKRIKDFTITDNKHMLVVWNARQQEVGSYCLEVSGKLDEIDWRFYDKTPIFEIVLTNAEANIPQLSIISEDYYSVNMLRIQIPLAASNISIPNFAAVATTGSYNDLIDRPTLFGGDYEDLTNKPDLSVYKLKDGNKVLSDNNYTDEDKATVQSVSTDYYTKSQINADFQSKLISGTNIKTVNNNSLLGSGNVNITVDLEDLSLPTANASTTNRIYLKNSTLIENTKEAWVTDSHENTIYNALEVYLEDDNDVYEANDAAHLAFEGGISGFYIVKYGEYVSEFIPVSIGDIINDHTNNSHYEAISINNGFGWSGKLSGIITDTTITYTWKQVGSGSSSGAEGKSAYQSYVDTTTDNPVLSESAWVASLHGTDGTNGTNGADGTNGINGIDGITPIVSVTSITGGHNVAFSYGNGDNRNTDFNVMDGSLANQAQVDWNLTDNTLVDYIKNKPTIPAAPVQSDWNESSSSSLAYIANKPTIPTVPSNETAVSGGSTLSVVTTGEKYTWNNKANIWSGTQAQYDLLTPDSNTIYIITAAS